MTTENEKDRVALRNHPEFIGTVAGPAREAGLVEVEFDGGGRGRFKTSDLVPADEAPVTNKTWPPAGLETKAAAP